VDLTPGWGVCGGGFWVGVVFGGRGAGGEKGGGGGGGGVCAYRVIWWANLKARGHL